MSNCVFGFPDFTQATPLVAPVASGTGFVASLPATNVLDRRLNLVARSASAGTFAINVDLGATRSVGLLAALVPNVTKTATPAIVWSGGTASNTNDIYSSGSLPAWPTGLTAEDVTGADGSPLNIWAIHIPSVAQSARYWQFSISDGGNADGYVDVARVVIAGAYRPSVCMQTGAKSGIEDDTVGSATDGGAMLYQARRARRTDSFTLPNTPRIESVESIRRMQHRLGKSGQVFFVWDETDPYKYERSYLATMRELGALEYSFSALYSSEAFEMAEVL